MLESVRRAHCGVDPTFGFGPARQVPPVYPRLPGAVTKGEPPLVTIGFLRTFPSERQKL